jgi:hypothetical protein
MMIALLGNMPSRGEEILNKKGVSFLGHKLPENKFQPCSGPTILVGNGTIEATKDRCGKSSRSDVIVTIVEVNTAGRTATVKTNDGKAYQLTLSADLAKSLTVSDSWPLVGTTVTLSGLGVSETTSMVLRPLPEGV